MGGVGVSVWGCPMHAHACAYDIIGFHHGGGHLHEIIMFNTHAYACVHVHMCACVCICVGPSPCPQTLPPT